MARIRSTFPGQWTDEDFVECSALARLLALALRNEADDQGVFEWKPVGLKMRLMPADNIDMAALLSELEERRQIARFTAHGKVYGAIRNFVRFQKPRKPTKVHPLPPELHEWVRMDLWGATKKRSGSEPDADQYDDGSEPDDDDAGASSEPPPRSRAASSELKPPQRRSSSEPDRVQRPPVPKSSETAAQREEGGGKREVNTRSGEAAAPTRVGAREPAAAAARNSGDPEFDRKASVADLLAAVGTLARTWFGPPDRPLHGSDGETVAGWLDAALDAGIEPRAATRTIAEALEAQFQGIAARGAGCPKSLKAMLDADIRAAIASAAATARAAPPPPGPPLSDVPARFARRFDRVVWSRWLAQCAFTGPDADGVATVAAPTKLVADMLAARHLPDLCACLEAREVEIVVREPKAA